MFHAMASDTREKAGHMRIALKGALADPAQLADRLARLAALGLPARLELHVSRADDFLGEGERRVRQLRAEAGDPVELLVHIPPQSVPVVTRTAFDAGQVAATLAFAQAVGAGAVVMHRYHGLALGSAPAHGTRAEAEAAFNEAVRDLARQAPDVTLLVENLGHYHLAPRGGGAYLSGPLDHFFPWEIAAFQDYAARERLDNVRVLVDVAHATLSANMFNLRRHRPEAAADDRFRWITDADLQRAATLHPFDFVLPGIGHLHVSDSVLLTSADWAGWPANDRLAAALTAEGMEVGTGTLPWTALPNRFGAEASPLLVMEVEPGPGESHRANAAQERSARRLMGTFGRT